MSEKKKGFDLAAALGEVSNLDTGMEGREQIEYIDIGLLHQDERNFYELPGIPELAANIEFAGLQQPLRVRPDPEREGQYIIISGHRRYAALTQLAGEGQDQFRLVACIVEKPSGRTSEVEALLQELKLIYGNSDTRKLSSADISKQAERVEMLLYQLKEAGVEFPGKMRDHVAEACKVSASKLARLKVIREKLDEAWEPLYKKGTIKESVAYALAQLSPEHQQIIYAKLKDGKYYNEHSIREYGERLKQIDKMKCSQAGHKGECLNRAGKVKHAMSLDSYQFCQCGKCCSGCSELIRCKEACPLLADEVRNQREAAKAQRAQDKEAAAERNRPDVEKITALWARFAQARTDAGLSIEGYTKATGIYVDEQTKKRWPKQEQGEKITRDTGLPYFGGRGISLYEIKQLCMAADALGVSIDYLLCRTDNPEVNRINRQSGCEGQGCPGT